MDVINALLSLVMALKVPSPFFEVLAVVIVVFAFWYTFESILTKRIENRAKSLDNEAKRLENEAKSLDNQKKRLDNELLKKQLSQPESDDTTPSAPTLGEDENL
ncbi:hypothetical protein [Bacillus cereus]|uniref:hypothetical protein n=1 Tax=Bacillus cereus TaxID=1396 RepID=UPI000B7F20FA|nr:hypothetical protein [Bacillus cereus]